MLETFETVPRIDTVAGARVHKSAFPLSIVVPIYNEEGLLWQMAETLSRDLDATVGIGAWQYVLVENGSTDATPKIVERIVATWPGSIKVALPRPNIGLALRRGLEAAQSDYAYIINVDFWDGLFLRWAWANRLSYDLILGSKRADPSLNRLPPYRKMLSWGLNLLFQVFFGFVGRDTHGQKMLYLPAMLPIIERCVMERGQFDTEFTLRALRRGLWVAEVPVPVMEQRRQRNLMIRKIWNNLVDVLRLNRVMSPIPFTKTRYHRWAREDMELMHVVSWGKRSD
ncbi:MAG: glycosyltransferase family 2 protein [Hyphomicrobiales bacterium]|nr:glycosyltransferase family 2 protein [Hyphomicrobiales bacterium]